MHPSERRQFQRLHFEDPILARFASSDVEILDLSLHGARIAHLKPFATGAAGTLEFSWYDEAIALPCEIVRCRLERPADAASPNNIYYSGMRYRKTREADGMEILRDVISSQVVRAVEEQIANARGEYIPDPERMTIFRSSELMSLKTPRHRHVVPGVDHAYVSCAMTPRGWKKVTTGERTQPPMGFTVSALEDPRHIDLLCRTWEKADEQTRRMITLLAELSIA